MSFDLNVSARQSSPKEPTPKIHFPASGQGYWAFAFAACFLLLILLGTRKIESYDLGTHLKSGSWIVQNHAFPSKDTFTYTQNTQDYLDSNGLYQILLYSLQTLGGYPALTLMNIAVFIAVFGILAWRLLLSGANPPWACLFFFVAILVMERRFFVRPELFSWLFLSLTLLILEYREKGRNYLYLLPLIQLFWVNMEGLFVLGWAPIVTQAARGYLQRRKLDKALIHASFLCLGADLLNPYFFKGVAFPFILWSRLQGSNLHKQNISELASPIQSFFYLTHHHDSALHLYLFFFLVATVAILLVATFKKRNLNEITLVVIFGILAFSAIRNIPFFVLVSVPLIPVMLQDRLRGREEPFFRQKSLPILSIILILLLCARVVTNAYYISDRRVDRFGLGLGEYCLPVKAATFLNLNHLDQRILNTLNDGGWLNWQAPQLSFIDGRSEVMSDDFYAEYLESQAPGGLSHLVARYQPQLILVDYNTHNTWVDQLRGSSDWRLIYLDDCSALYAAKDYALQLPTFDFTNLLSNYEIPFILEEDMLSIVSQGNPHPFNYWVSGFFKPQTYPLGLSNLGLFALKYGQYPVARMFFLRCLQLAGGHYEEIFFNLGISNLHLGNFELGRLCLQQAFKLDPSNPETRRMLSHFSQ